MYMSNATEHFQYLTHNVVEDALGWKLCAYLVALEGWRRGLTLKWYKAESDKSDIETLGMNPHGKIFSLSANDKTHFYFRSRGDEVSNKAVEICNNKEKTKTVISNAGVPVPKGKLFRKNTLNDAMITYAKNIGFPVVLKPTNGSMGRGVYSNIQDEKELRNAIENLRKERYSNYIIEKYFPGKEYRIYVVGDKVIGAINRIPANVVGNGQSSFKELIEKKNTERLKNPYLCKKPIKIDYEIKKMLENEGYTLDSIPSEGEVVYLREKSNLSSGGDPLDATNELTDEVKKIAVESLKAIPELPHAGVDVIVDPESAKRGTTIEINPTAEIGFHLFPLEGNPRDVPSAIIDYYFPETINKEKTNFYFDLKSVLEPLRTRSVDEVTVTQPPIGYKYGKKYTVYGKVQKKGYMNWIRLQALKSGMIGYAKTISDGRIEVAVISKVQNDVNEFKKVCLKGSKKSKVEKVMEQDWELDSPLKIGFEIISASNTSTKRTESKRAKQEVNTQINKTSPENVSEYDGKRAIRNIVRKIIKREGKNN